MISALIFNSSSAGKGSKGFSLLEIMVALVVLSIALTAVIKLFSQAVVLNTASCFYIKMPYQARGTAALWELKNSLPEAGFTLDSDGQPLQDLDISVNEQDLVPELASALPDNSIQTENDLALMEVSFRIFSKQDPNLSYTHKIIRLVRP